MSYGFDVSFLNPPACFCESTLDLVWGETKSVPCITLARVAFIGVFLRIVAGYGFYITRRTSRVNVN